MELRQKQPLQRLLIAGTSWRDAGATRNTHPTSIATSPSERHNQHNWGLPARRLWSAEAVLLGTRKPRPRKPWGKFCRNRFTEKPDCRQKRFVLPRGRTGFGGMSCKPNGFTKFSIGPTGNGTAGIVAKRSRPGAKKRPPRRSVVLPASQSTPQRWLHSSRRT
jgi:hypothetical protein